MNERRQHPRFPALIKATADVAGVRSPVICIDIGPGGAYFTGRLEPTAGRRLDIDLRPTGTNTPAVTITATVTYLLGPGHARPPGFGVRWDVAVSRAGAEPLRRVLHQLLRVPESVDLDMAAGASLFDFTLMRVPLAPSPAAQRGVPEPPTRRVTQPRIPAPTVENAVRAVADDIARGPSRYERRPGAAHTGWDAPPRAAATRAQSSMPSMAPAPMAPTAPAPSAATSGSMGSPHVSPTPIATAVSHTLEQARGATRAEPLDLGPMFDLPVAPSVVRAEPGAKVPRVALVPAPALNHVPQSMPADKRSHQQGSDPDEEAAISFREPTRLDVWPTGVPRALSERYEQLQQLGEGGNGIVYLAQDKLLDRTVVLKFMAPGSVARPLARKYFLREFRVSTRLTHPNIVKIYDVGSTDGVLHYAMEYLDGDTLGAHLAGGKVLAEPHFVYSVMSQLCEALEYAHSQNVLHRDVKPNNVVVLGDGTVKLLDFGLARVQEEGCSEQSLVVGTPHYMAPEQQTRGRIDHRTDIYALGVVLYRMLAGRLPFIDGNVLIAHAVEAVPDPRQFNPDLPQALVDVLHRMLAKQPEDRYPHCTAVALDLHRALFGPPRP